MQLKDFVQKIRQLMDGVKGECSVEKIYKDSQASIYLESRIFLSDLSQLLQQYESSLEEVTAESVKPFCELLANRSGIQNTNAIYCHNHLTFANQIALGIAKALSDTMGVHPYHLLFPNLKKEIIYHGELSHVVMSDDNTTFIDVCGTLSVAAEAKTPELKHTHTIDAEPLKLTESEKNRVITHSKLANYLYYDIVHKKNTLDNNCKRLKKWFQKSDKEWVSSASYGEQGFVLLRSYINAKLSNASSLATLLKNSPDDEWENILSALSVSELEVLVAKNRPQDWQIASGDERFDCALQLIGVYLYYKKLDARPNDHYSLFPGRWFGLFDQLGKVNGYAKPVKLSAVKMIYAKLLRDKNLGEFNDYLKAEENQLHAGPLSQGNLRVIKDNILAVSKQYYCPKVGLTN